MDFCGVFFVFVSSQIWKSLVFRETKGHLKRLKYNSDVLVFFPSGEFLCFFFRLEGLISLGWVLGPIFAGNFNECRTPNPMRSTIPFK